MVENKHSVNNILSFGAKSVNPKILEKLLVGREKTVAYLFDSVEGIVKHQQNHFILIVGQRGMGKTHLIRVLFHRIQPFIKKKKIEVAYFSEEEYGVANYFDFLLRIINALMKWNENDKELLQQKIVELQETRPTNREHHAEHIIEEYIGDKPLLILTENFADILEDIKPKEQAKLRSWIYRKNKISIIATSQAISKDFESEERPFYGTFNTYYLKKITFNDTLEFLTLLAKQDKRNDVAEFINKKGKGQIKALHRLVKGNHRLLVTFYQFLKTNTLADLSVNFIKTINDLKPYYETYIRNLPPQQQKVLRYIALNKTPQLGVNISRNCFIEQKSLTKQLSELTRKKLIEAIPNPNDKRNKLYDIDEPLLRISIEVGEHKEGITAIFIDFLAIYYNEDELIDRKIEFEKQQSECESLMDKTKWSFEIEAIDKAIALRKAEYSDLDRKNITEAIRGYLKRNKEEGLYAYLKKENLIKSKGEFHFTYGMYLNLIKDYDKSISQYKKADKIKPNNKYIYNNWGIALVDLAKKTSNIELFQGGFKLYNKATSIDSSYAFAYNNWGVALSELAIITSDEELYKESFEKFKTSIQIDYSYFSAYRNWGMSITKLAIQNFDKQLFNDGIDKFKKAIEFNVNDNSIYIRWGVALYNFGLIKDDVELYQESIKKYEKALKIDSTNTFALLNTALALSKIGKLKKDEKEYEKAFKLFKIIVKLKSQDYQCYYEWGSKLMELALLKDNKNILKESIRKFKMSIKINANHFQAYNNLGIALFTVARVEGNDKLLLDSIIKYKKVIELNPNHNFAYYNWALSLIELSFLNNNYNLFPLFIENLNKAISINPIEISFYNLLKYGIQSMPKKENMSTIKMIEVIKTISTNDVHSIISEWAILILRLNKDITEKQIKILHKIIKKHKKNAKELIITEIYINIYKQYIIEGNKKAVYDLPKEQRLFFEEEILGKLN